jgi:hypothetical protein
MGSPADLQKLASSTSKQVAELKLPEFPPYPEALKQRFPDMARHEQEVKIWLKKVTFNVQGGS